MRELLDTPTQRRLKILEHLNEMSDWISSNELAQENNASLRTINNDVSYLKENWYPYLLIETSKKNGVRLRTQPSSHVEFVYRYVLKQSESFRLLEAMFFDTSLSIEKWGEKLFISESSLYRITSAMADSLKKYGLTLEKKPCRIIGTNEHFVRYFYTSYFREAYNATEWPFPVNKKDSVLLIRELAKIFDFELNDNQLIQMNYILNVSLIRQSQGFYINSTIKNNHLDDIFNKLSLYQAEFESLAYQYKLPVDEKMLQDLISAIFLHQSNWESTEEELLVTKEINQFIKTIRDSFDLTLSDDIYHKIEGTMKQLYLYHRVYPFRNHIIYDSYFYNGTAIKKDYPILNMVVEHSLNQMEKHTNFPWENVYHNIILYWLMVTWSDLPELLKEKKEKAKLFVLSDLGRDHSEFLVKMIRSNFGSKVEINSFQGSIILLDEDKPKDLDSYDILVTNFNTDDLPKEKLVVIDDIPSGSDWGILRRAINNINKINPNMLDVLNHK
ncbi:helix-turn-helix domain-containing protein [Vagococcus sp. DIV0080]|uniref:Helix-turn-helix domain-containing protein n=1 Tax=Candidatus Vagococcus giribetii TaxID=2230876 RepID=A0ABS3HVF4_9ENTE|nr:helix-turn-helix domain-containing protein [Vagococcus sp. DIV0080]MBO0477736.1 helix-turn-helix domain-containing protein [Vagococcus sp. DIV0080]